jgi:3-keto-disaccharide hydrolase/SLA1 Homology Domain 1 (SHD1) protein
MDEDIRGKVVVRLGRSSIGKTLQRKAVLFAAVAVALGTGNTVAQKPEPAARVSVQQSRVWTDASGRHRIEAEFVSLTGKTVHLRTVDGRDIRLTIDKLSAADRRFAKDAANQIALRGTATRGWIELLAPDGPRGWQSISAELKLGGDSKLAPTSGLLAPTRGDGVIVAEKKLRNTNLVSRQSFVDCEVQLDFMLGKGSNSGVKLHGIYEIQLRDSYGKQKMTARDCGGVYPRGRPGKPGEAHKWILVDQGVAPTVNAAKPAGQWQSLVIVFRAPRFRSSGKKVENARFVSVLLNGQLIHKDVELAGSTGFAYQQESQRGPLLLQLDHGPVAFRRVRIRPLDAEGKTSSAPARPNSTTPEMVRQQRGKSSQLYRLDEICTTEFCERDPWISPDGSTLYYACYAVGKSNSYPPERTGVFVVSRKGAKTAFGVPRQLLNWGRHPTATADGLEIAFLRGEAGKGEWIYLASRLSSTEDFGPATRFSDWERPFPEGRLKSPAFSHDGNRLYFNEFLQRRVLVVTRPGKGNSFGPPADVSIALGETRRPKFCWHFFTDDELFMFCEIGGSLTLWQRESPDVAFCEFVFLELPAIGRLRGRSPRYCEETRELFFAAPNDFQSKGVSEDPDADWDIWVVRNFDPTKVDFRNPKTMAKDRS